MDNVIEQTLMGLMMFVNVDNKPEWRPCYIDTNRTDGFGHRLLSKATPVVFDNEILWERIDGSFEIITKG